MKKIYIPLISLIAIIALFLIGFMVNVMNDGFDSMFFNNFSFMGEMRVVSDETYKSDGINTIDIDLSSEQVKVYQNDTDEIRVVESMSKALSEDSWAVTDISSSTFRLYRKTSIYFNVNIRIEVYLPKSYSKDLSVSTYSGSIHLEDDLTLDNCVLTASSGSIRLSGIQAHEIKCQTSSGSVRSEKTITADYADFDSSSGSINLYQVYTQTIDANTNSGGIRIEDVTGTQDFSCSSGSIRIQKSEGVQELSTSSGSIDVDRSTGGGIYKSTSGSIRLEFNEINEDIVCEASSGSVRINVPEDAAFNFKAKSSSGGIHTYFENFTSSDNKKQRSAVIGNQPTLSIKITTTSGSINLT